MRSCLISETDLANLGVQVRVQVWVDVGVEVKRDIRELAAQA